MAPAPPTPLTRPTAALDAFVTRHGIERGETPLASLRELTSRIHEALDFERGQTRVDSPIDDALAAESGVCQDFSHIMLAIVRGWGIPAQYVSGYLFPVHKGREQTMAQASHAWIECLLPGLGWVGADPTNNTVSPRHHVRVATGGTIATFLPPAAPSGSGPAGAGGHRQHLDAGSGTLRRSRTPRRRAIPDPQAVTDRGGTRLCVLRFARKTPSIPPSRAASAGFLTGFQADVGSPGGC